jgi:BASS family bile acid:Na+ symporter
MIVSTMLGAGLQVNLQHVGAMLRRYDLWIKAFVANFVLLPLFAWFLVNVFHVDTYVSVGILLMAMAPGVPFLVNSAAAKQGGSLSFALGIAFLFSGLSVITVPITAALIMPVGLQLPWGKFLTTLLGFQLVPLIVGALVSSRLSAESGEKVARVLHLAFLAAALGLLVVVGPKLLSSVASVYGFGHLLVIAAIGIFALAVGWLLGGPDRQFRRTLSIGTLMRNIGLAALVGTSDFADTLVVPAVLTYFLVTFVLSLPVRMYYKRTRDAVAG